MKKCIKERYDEKLFKLNTLILLIILFIKKKLLKTYSF